MLGWSETCGFLLAHATGCKLCQEVAGIEPWSEPSAPARASVRHMHVFFEILVVMGMKENQPLKPFIVVLLQRYRRPGHILGTAITGALIENPYAVVYGWSQCCALLLAHAT